MEDITVIAFAGFTEIATERAMELLHDPAIGAFNTFNLAATFAVMGDVQRFLTAARLTLERGYPHIKNFARYVDLPVGHDPQVQAFLREIGAVVSQ